MYAMQPLDSQLASQIYMYFIIERQHKRTKLSVYVSMQFCGLKITKVAKRLGLGRMEELTPS